MAWFDGNFKFVVVVAYHLQFTLSNPLLESIVRILDLAPEARADVGVSADDAFPLLILQTVTSHERGDV